MISEANTVRPDSCYLIKRNFKPNSNLHKYLASTPPSYVSLSREEYSIVEIFNQIKEIIKSKKLFDDQNPSIILCDEELDNALNVKALHVTELKDFILQQMITENEAAHDPPSIQQLIPDIQATSSSTVMSAATSSAEPNSIPTIPIVSTYWATSTPSSVPLPIQNFNVNGYYFVNPKLLKVLRMVERAEQDRELYHYPDVSYLLFYYIASREDRLIDDRNKQVCIVEGDPLGEAFNLRAFHRCQLVNLLRAQLVAAPPGILRPVSDISSSHVYIGEVEIDYSDDSDSSDAKDLHRVFSSNEDSIHEDVSLETANTLLSIKEDLADLACWGDCDEKLEESKEDFCNSGADSLKTYQRPVHLQFQNCIQCETIIEWYIRYCSHCWKERKKWIPYREKPRQRRKTFFNNPSRKRTQSNADLDFEEKELTQIQPAVIKHNIISKGASKNLATCVPNVCDLCCIRSKNAAFIHGQISHQISCYQCAKKMMSQHGTCPVCRRKVEKITKHIAS